jgi:hypothetical protein
MTGDLCERPHRFRKLISKTNTVTSAKPASGDNSPTRTMRIFAALHSSHNAEHF